MRDIVEEEGARSVVCSSDDPLPEVLARALAGRPEIQWASCDLRREGSDRSGLRSLVAEADIEMVLTEGVHGPGRVYILLVREGEGGGDGGRGDEVGAPELAEIGDAK